MRERWSRLVSPSALQAAKFDLLGSEPRLAEGHVNCVMLRSASPTVDGSGTVR
jgi:hypothetical protein